MELRGLGHDEFAGDSSVKQIVKTVLRLAWLALPPYRLLHRWLISRNCRRTVLHAYEITENTDECSTPRWSGDTQKAFQEEEY